MESCTMEQQHAPTEPSFAAMTATSTVDKRPAWARNSRTTLAYGTGRLPSHQHQLGWQPIAGPGALGEQRPMSSTLRSLHQRIVRGEA